MRGPKDICLICNTKHSDETGSHLMPNFLLKYIIGNRYYEAAWFIDAQLSKISNFFGAANIANSDTTPKRNEHVRDYIFCRRCEKWLSKIEAYAAEFLNTKIRGDRYKQNYQVEAINEDISLKTSNNVSSAIIHLCLFSVVYRILLQYRLDHGEDALNLDIVEHIRSFIAPYVDNTIEELKKLKLNPPIPYTIFSNEELEMGDSLFGYTFNRATNPEVFLMGRYIFLLFAIRYGVPILDSIPEIMLSPHLANTSNSEVKTVFVSSKVWNLFIQHYANTSAEIFNNEIVKKIARVKNVSEFTAKSMLKEKIEELQAEHSELQFAEALAMASEYLEKS